jgi:transposase-like protein
VSKIRKKHSGDFKGKVALEAIRGLKTANEIALGHKIHPVVISQWKRIVEENIGKVFTSDASRGSDASKDKLIEQLYKALGQSQFELEWIKKKLQYQ